MQAKSKNKNSKVNKNSCPKSAIFRPRDFFPVKEIQANFVQTLPKTKSIRTQYKITDFKPEFGDTVELKESLLVKIPLPKKMKTIGINTDLSFDSNDDINITKIPLTCNEEIQPQSDHDSDIYDSGDEDSEIRDPNFEPDVEAESQQAKALPEHTKLVVFWSCILPLLQNCMLCRQTAFIKKTFFKGTQLIVDLICKNHHETKWYSQPNERGYAVGNLSLSASILFSGNTFQRIKEMMSIAKIPFMSHVTFNRIQKRFLFPAIHRVFTTNRTLLLEFIRPNEIELLGDGRCDSPGYSAKYGTYTVMDSSSGFILDFHVSHCKMAGNSAGMELDGLNNVLRRLDDQQIQVLSLTTDRHKQVRKFMRTERKDISHQFDVWHVGRNIKKKLLKVAKKKACQDLQLWIKSIINHFWWCCASCNGDAKLLKENWVSILHHITDKHRWKNGKTWKKCFHAKLTKEQRCRKPFLDLRSPSYIALERIILDKSLLGAFDHLTSFNHTGTLEVYHSLYNKYCPKRLHFSYAGMIAHSQLAVLDFNTGVCVIQAETRDGIKRYKLQFSKITQSWVVKKVKNAKEKTYIDHLMFEVFNIVVSKTHMKSHS